MAEDLAAPAGVPKPLAPPGGAAAEATQAAVEPAGAAEASSAPPSEAPAAAPADDKAAAAQPAGSAGAADPKAAAPPADAKASGAEAAAPVVPLGPFKLLTDSASMQGRGPTQEDRNVKIPDLTKAAKALKMPIDHLEQPCAFFALYDGHRGHQCAEFAAKGFHMKLLKRLTATAKICGPSKESADKLEEAIRAALREVCEEIDAEFMGKFRTATDGCTLSVALLTGARLHVAWLGNARCLLGRQPRPEEAADAEGSEDPPDIVLVPATEDHRPSIAEEAERVRKAGGSVIDFGAGSFGVAHEGYEEKLREIRRTQALGQGIVTKPPVCLPISRALGDRDFKATSGKALLVPTPGVTTLKLDESHKFGALISGGISASMLDKDVVEELDLIHDPSDPLADVRAACGALVQEAYKRESPENLTVILFRLQWNGARGYRRKVAKIEKAKQAAAALLAAAEPAKAESAAAASKRRRLEAKEAVKAQKVAAYSRAVASGAGAANAAEEAKKEAEVAKMRAEVNTAKAEVAKAEAEERAKRAAESEEAGGEGLDAAEAFFAARRAAKQAKTGDGDAAAAKPDEGKGLDAAEAFFAARKAKKAEEEKKAEEPQGLDAAEAFFAARKAKKAEAEAAQPAGLDAAEAFFAARKAKAAEAAQPSGLDAAEAFFAARKAKKAEGTEAASTEAASLAAANAETLAAPAKEEVADAAQEAADDGLVFL